MRNGECHAPATLARASSHIQGWETNLVNHTRKLKPRAQVATVCLVSQ